VKVILDTNVLVSGIFFGGYPYRILDAWKRGKIRIVLSEEIFDEYERVIKELSRKFKEIDVSELLTLIAINSIWVGTNPLPFNVSEDPDDDKFISCAIASRTRCVISGDKHLLALSGFQGIEVLKPKVFVERYLK